LRLQRIQIIKSRPASLVDVCLPNGYSPDKRYQLLFDSSKAGCIPETIVVGVWNKGKLHRSEYFPQKFLQLMPGALGESVIQQRPEGQGQDATAWSARLKIPLLFLRGRQ
jgi:hypothetical protein